MNELSESLDELDRLADSAGAIVVGRILQKSGRFHSAHVVGSGKLEEIAADITAKNVDLVVFDDELSPSQIRNLEERLNCKVIDRSMLILDIFARHAHTKESRTQVELAQYEYLYPRLSGQWTHLSKQWGGIGSKGPGETQLEVDRRLVGKRIQKLKRELEKIDKERDVQRKGRTGLFKVVMVGYTNAGKSTLFTTLTRARVWAADQLFCTLDPTTRAMSHNGSHDGTPRILLTDTIGFIRKLPAPLFAAFRATLSEVSDADLLLHVIDYASPSYQQEVTEVERTLCQIGADEIPRLVVLNKIDLLNGQPVAPYHVGGIEAALAVSAATGVGCDRLVAAILARAKNTGNALRQRSGRTGRARVHWESATRSDPFKDSPGRE
ncbi:MAG: GTPase HflX [Candidatus Zixiibacteriota bacterium]